MATAVGVSSAVRMGIMGGRGTLAGADSSVVARTTGIIVDLLDTCGGDLTKGSTMGMWGMG